VSTSRSTEQSVAVALAGTVPVQVAGDLVRLTFKAKHGIQRNWSSDLHVTHFVLNETDLSTAAPAITIDLQTIKGIPTEFQLSQNYPNPFNPTTTIEYQIPVTGTVSVKVYDGLGKQVAVLVDREERAGYYAVTWNGRNTAGQSVASGMYFYRVQAVGNDGRAIAKVHRMLLLK
jgi:hypothetical protein